MKVAQIYLNEENSRSQYCFCISHETIKGFTWWVGTKMNPTHMTLEEYLSYNKKTKLIGDFNETE